MLKNTLIKSLNLSIIILVTALITLPLCHARRGIYKPAPVRKINQTEGRKRIESFRQWRYNGDYSFKFDMKHMPRRGRGKTFQGVLWGSWNPAGPVMRMELWPGNAPNIKAKFLIQSGPEPKVWIQQPNEPGVHQLSEKEFFEPLFEGVTYTPFDMLMSFIYWNDFTYEGSEKVKSRQAHLFLMKPPQSIRANYSKLSAVRVVMDAHYNFLLRADQLDRMKQPRKSFRLIDFKKVQNEYIAKTMDLVDESTHEKTRLQVIAAAMGLHLDRSTFDPEYLSENLKPLNSRYYQSIR